jgi:hypothetical protein
MGRMPKMKPKKQSDKGATVPGEEGNGTAACRQVHPERGFERNFFTDQTRILGVGKTVRAAEYK